MGLLRTKLSLLWVFVSLLCWGGAGLKAQVPGGILNVQWGKVHYECYLFPNNVGVGTTVPAATITNISDIDAAIPDFAGYVNYPDGTGGRNTTTQLYNFAYRYTAYLYAVRSGVHNFYVRSDDGYRLSINGSIRGQFPGLRGCLEDTIPVNLTANTWYTFELDFFNGSGPNCLQLEWAPPSLPRGAIPVPADATANALTGGLCAPVMNTWLEAGAATPTAWPDRGGWNSMTIAAGNPTPVAGTADPAFNYKPYVALNASRFVEQYYGRDGMRALSTNEGAGNGGAVFMVLQTNDVTNPETPISYAVGTTFAEANHFLFLRANNTQLITNGAAAVNTSLSYNGSPKVISTSFSNTTTLRVNEGNEFSITPNSPFRPSGNGFLTLGEEQDVRGGSFQAVDCYRGRYAEVIIYNRDLNANERRRIQSYLATKYGITLGTQSYRSSQDVVYWDRTLNTTAGTTHRIFGVARDTGTFLYSGRSRSVEAGGAALEVTANLPSLGANQHAYWMCADNNGPYGGTENATNFPTTQIPGNIDRRSARFWRVDGLNFNIPVTLTFDVSSFPATALADADFYLLVNNTAPDFSTATTIVGAQTGNTITFSNVTLSPGQFFTIGYGEPPVTSSFTNLDAGAPTGVWEACRGSRVQFSYVGRRNAPANVRLRHRNGTTIIITAPQLAVTHNNTTRSGVITFTIPNEAVTGPVEIWGTVNRFYLSPGFLLIHNPVPDFQTVNPAPFCVVGDSTALIGLPAGGTFSALLGATADTFGLISQNAGTFYFNPARYVFSTGSTNGGTQNINLRYRYRPLYSNGAVCPRDTFVTKVVTIRDNRLTEVAFNLIEAPRVLNSTMTENLNTLRDRHSPTFPASTYTWSYSGNFVDNSTSTPRFVYGAAGFGTHVITASYNNGGCIGSVQGQIEVLPEVSIPGLPSFVCRDAGVLPFYRDQAYRDTIVRDTFYERLWWGGQRISHIRVSHRGRLQGSPTHSPTISPNPITQVQFGTNQELYNFNPAVVPGTTTSINVNMRFVTEEVTTFYSYPWFCLFSSCSLGDATQNVSTRSFTFEANWNMAFVPRPNVRVDSTLTGNFCANQLPIAARSEPVFVRGETRYWLENVLNSNQDTLTLDTLIDFQRIYRQQDSTETQNVDFRLIYEVNRFGCIDRDTGVFRIVAPVRPTVSGRNSARGNVYCFTESEDLLVTTPSISNGGPSTTITGAGIGRFNSGSTSPFPQMFGPRAAGVGIHPVVYTYQDAFGCLSQVRDTLIVRPRAAVSLSTINGRTQYCANGTADTLVGTIISGAGLDTMIYTGAGVSGNLFNPSLAFGGGFGTDFVYVLYRDTFGCEARDTLPLTVNAVPTPSFGSVQTVYCGNSPTVSLPLNPAPNTGLGGVVSGLGVFQQSGVFFFNPATVFQNGQSSALLTYNYTNTSGCVGSSTITLQVDTVPDVRITNITPQYCINAPSVMLQGQPNGGANGIGFYSGPGMNPNTGEFTPSLAGIGDKVVVYNFTDNNGCTNESRDTVNILPFPNANFTGLNPEYCIDALPDTLFSVNPNGTGVFVGNMVLDPSGIILPSLDTAGLRSITHVFTDLAGCTNTLTQTFYVHPLPTVSLAGFDSAYCQSGNDSRIIGVPVGGQITGNRSNTGLNIVAAGVAFFSPAQADTGAHQFVYSFTSINGCTNRDTVDLVVFPSYVPTVTGLASTYCETRDSFALTPNPLGGQFGGTGILTGTNLFVPRTAGSGNHTVRYTTVDSFPLGGGRMRYCENTVNLPVTVYPLPVPRILSPTDNSTFCENDTAARLLSGGIATGNITFERFRSTSNLRLDTTLIFDLSTGTFSIDSTYFFVPSLAGQGSHSVTFTAFNQFGCSDSIVNTYFVYPVPQPSFTPLAATYCESDPAVPLVGSPLGGVFYRNGQISLSPAFVPSPNYPAQRLQAVAFDTISYVVNDRGCVNTASQVVQINPNPVVSFSGQTADNRYCLLPDSITLTPSRSGGVFLGNGVVFGTNLFSPQISGVGAHLVRYAFLDSLTGCADSYVDTIRIYSQPIVRFEAIGACQDQAINFVVDNSVLDLNRFFQSQYFDSITLVRWDFGDGTAPAQAQNPLNPRQVADMQYQYLSPGDYRVQLLVENQGTCRDSFSVRLPVVPKISQFPYLQTFNDDSGGWVAEDRGQQQSSIWNWGVPANPGRIDVTGATSSNNSNMWSTAIGGQAYPLNADAWVYSPCFDLTTLDRPMMKMDFWSHTEPNVDGTVIEYMDANGDWQPLGQLNRGINWYNTPVIAGRPGDQNLAPRGWSGFMDNFANARYQLDELRYQSDSSIWKNFRMRVAFGASSISPSRASDGFAFDNVWIGNRRRNSVLEHVSNVGAADMANINNHVYDLCFRTPVLRDVILLQYQHSSPAEDQFYLFNQANHNARTFYYGFSEPGYSVINGEMQGPLGLPSFDLRVSDFEVPSLQDPLFELRVDSFRIIGNNAVASVRVDALDNLPAQPYRLRFAVLEDSLIYTGSSVMVNAVVRKLMPDDGINLNRSFTAGERIGQSASWNFAGTGIVPTNLTLVAFIQNDSTKEIYQAVSSRDLVRFINLLGDEQPSPEALAQANVLETMRLYPNPTSTQFTVEIEGELQEDLQWQLLDVQGRSLSQGRWIQGERSQTLDVQDLPGGLYIFLAQGARVAVHRKVIVRK